MFLVRQLAKDRQKQDTSLTICKSALSVASHKWMAYQCFSPCSMMHVNGAVYENARQSCRPRIQGRNSICLLVLHVTFYSTSSKLLDKGEMLESAISPPSESWRTEFPIISSPQHGTAHLPQPGPSNSAVSSRPSRRQRDHSLRHLYRRGVVRRIRCTLPNSGMWRIRQTSSDKDSLACSQGSWLSFWGWGLMRV